MAGSASSPPQGRAKTRPTPAQFAWPRARLRTIHHLPRESPQTVPPSGAQITPWLGRRRAPSRSSQDQTDAGPVRVAPERNVAARISYRRDRFWRVRTRGIAGTALRLFRPTWGLLFFELFSDRLRIYRWRDERRAPKRLVTGPITRRSCSSLARLRKRGVDLIRTSSRKGVSRGVSTSHLTW